MSNWPKHPRLLTTAQAAQLLNVSSQTILNWIRDDAVPYMQLPTAGKRREYRIPLRGLLQSLSGNYDLDAELDELLEALGLELEGEG